MQAAVTAPEVYSFAESSHTSALSYLHTGPWIRAKRPKSPFFPCKKFQDWKIGQSRKCRCLGDPAFNAEHKDCVCFQHYYICRNRPFLAMHSHEVLCQTADNGNHPGSHYFGGSLPWVQHSVLGHLITRKKQTNWRQFKKQLKWFGGWKDWFMRKDDELNICSFTE